ADHRYRPTAAPETLDGSGLVHGQDLRRHLVDAEPAGHGVHHGPAIACDHGNPHAEVVEGGDCLLRFGPDLVLEGDGPGDRAIDDNMQNDSTLAIPVGGYG